MTTASPKRKLCKAGVVALVVVPLLAACGGAVVARRTTSPAEAPRATPTSVTTPGPSAPTTTTISVNSLVQQACQVFDQNELEALLSNGTPAAVDLENNPQWATVVGVAAIPTGGLDGPTADLVHQAALIAGDADVGDGMSSMSTAQYAAASNAYLAAEGDCIQLGIGNLAPPTRTNFAGGPCQQPGAITAASSGQSMRCVAQGTEDIWEPF